MGAGHEYKSPMEWPDSRLTKLMNERDVAADQIINLGKLVIRLVRQTRRFDPENKVAEQAMYYLARQGWVMSPLRDTTPPETTSGD